MLSVFIKRQEKHVCKYFFFRSKQNWGNQAFYPKHDPDDSVEDIISSFISQFYENKTIPRLILTNCEVKDKPLKK